ncbi:hypothetical protein HUX88_23505 [Duganella sp. BJB1802]|uniref:hypothetical protein n=1 Tax=Duganella sp. BJB1802 TaxID=2744575 RepID=UPI001594A16E|nr:hypothetical protein [Duganella sp. BJB1802]NVD73482.1 hypothetical protein [Duganella sp. BJB1802]
MDSNLATIALRALQQARLQGINTSWVAGSLVENLGNSSSDVDIFVAVHDELRHDSVTRLGKDHGVLAFISEGIRFDIELWTLSQIRALIGKTSSIPINDPKRNNLHTLEYWESEFVHRLLTGVPLCEIENFAQLHNAVDRSTFVRYLFDTAVRRADDAFDDTIGMQRANQLPMACIRAMEAVEFSIDCFLHSNNITNDKTKFRLRKLELLGAKVPDALSIIEKYWSYRRFIPNEGPQQESYIAELLRFSSELVEGAQKKFRNLMQVD